MSDLFSTPQDYLLYYGTENYLFEVVGPKFRETGDLRAFDFFTIVIWKAERVKSTIAGHLLDLDKPGVTNLHDAVRSLASDVHTAESPRERLHVLMNGWGLYLPMASAILTVMYPDDFSVYDKRVCAQLDRFKELAWRSFSDSLWNDYTKYMGAVQELVEGPFSLRDKDRILWAKAGVEGLIRDIEDNFVRKGSTRSHSNRDG